MSIYRKTGITSRLEWTPHSRAFVDIVEAGVARHDGATFVSEATHADRSAGGATAAAGLEAFAARIGAAIPAPVRLDRVVIAAGSASHVLEAAERREWSDSNARCFASISLPDTPLQLEIDLGAATLERVDIAPLEAAAKAMRSFRGDMTPRHELRLAPIVSAALWRALSRTNAASPASRVFQSSHPDFRLDGNGEPIEECFAPPWPNAFRPSYRGAPLSMPFHLDVETSATDRSGSPSLVALLEPLRLLQNALVMVALCVDGEAAFRVVIALSPSAWLQSIRGASGSPTWFPFGAGSWGRDVTIAF